MQSLSDTVKAAGLRGAKVGKAGEFQSVTVKPGQVVDLMRLLKDKLGMKSLDCMTAVDHGEEFELVYHTLNYETAETVVGKTRVSRAAPIVESVSSVYPAANWFEREVLDLFGVEFTNHPNPVRMLRRDDEEGYPLRKDYSLRRRIPVVEDAD
ncbi:MAG: NADH-quinone oxidoreductase subunit C [Actinobacteria bacterium]|nr:MAG: NADH-quinone oxidoreductase subunit C [Actinomycetota bacterium]